jgi:hypothetical protein
MNKTRKNIKKNTKTRKNKRKSYNGYIVIDKYLNNVLGVNMYLYVVRLNQTIQCKKVVPKNNSKTLRFRKYLDISHLLKNYKIDTLKIEKNDESIMNKMISLFDIDTQYTYCLNRDTLVIAETKTNKNKSKIKDFFSKHGLLCDQTVCAAGEMRFYKNPNGNYKMVFDNGSGTFRPTKRDLQVLRKELPYFDIETVEYKP